MQKTYDWNHNLSASLHVNLFFGGIYLIIFNHTNAKWMLKVVGKGSATFASTHASAGNLVIRSIKCQVVHIAGLTGCMPCCNIGKWVAAYYLVSPIHELIRLEFGKERVES